jgi:TonB-linked SusC/RagA family outer membrane protein
MQFSFAQEKTVTGTVTDGKLPLPAANIKGAKGSVAADMDGKFSINAKPGEVLVVTYQGYESSSITVGAANNYKVSLKEKAKVLEDVVVGPMGIKRTKDAVVSAQKTVSSKELNQASNPNAIQALTGKVSGLQISTVSNGVSADTRILLRGTRSLTGDNQALVVIDGAISSATVLGQLPPDVIENVNVIKGAQGAALYGSQGVNGAILVTTKKGTKNEKFTFGFNSSIDFENVSFVPKTQQDYGQGWSSGYNFAFPGTDPRSGNPQYSPFENGSWGPSYSDPNWAGTVVPVGLPQANGQFITTKWEPIKDNIKKFFRTGTISQNSFNFNVGGPDSYAFLSVNRQSTDFVVQDDRLIRNSFLFKAGKRLGKFSIDGNANYISQSTSETNAFLMDGLLQTPSNVPVDAFGDQNQHHWTVFATSPNWTIKNERQDNLTNTFNGIISLGYEFTKNISINSTSNLRMRDTEFQTHKNAFTTLEANTPYDFGQYTNDGTNQSTYSTLLGGAGVITSNYYANQSSSRNIYNDLLVNFNYKLTNKIGLKANIGNNIQDTYFREMSQGGTNLDVPGFYNISNVLLPDNPTTLRSLGYYNRILRTRRVAGFVNIDLSYEDYLFLNATDRIEQMSTIAKSYQYPSLGVSFIPTKAFEGFKDNKVINYMKLNASYTSVGNASAVSPYAVNETTRIPQGFPFGNLAALAYNYTPTDPNIKPEYVNTFEIGSSIGFFKDRITLEGSYFNAQTKDLISAKTASSPSGASSLTSNIGNLSNKGFELDLGVTPVKTANFKWDMRFSYSTYKTKITSLGDGVTSINLQQPFAQVGIFAEVGEDFPLIKGTTFQRDGNGNIIVGANGAPLRNSAFTRLGKATPDYIVGFTNNFEYKNLKLTLVADFRTGASVWSEAKNLMFFTGGDLDTAGFDRTQGYVVPGVTTTGAVNTVPYGNDASISGTNNYFTSVHRAVGETSVIDATALKIREIALSYGLSKKMLKGSGIESFRIGVNARNPFVFLADGKLIKPRGGLAANNGYGDPEAANTAGNAQGIMNIGQYPTTKTVGVTLNLTF